MAFSCPETRTSDPPRHLAISCAWALIVGILAAYPLAGGPAATPVHTRDSAASIPESVGNIISGWMGTDSSESPILGSDLVALREAALSETAPLTTQAMNQDTQLGAIDTANYFLPAYRYAYMTGSTDELRAVSDPQCRFCSGAIEDAEALHRDGGWSDHWTIRIMSTTNLSPVGDSGDTRVDVVASSGQSTTHRGDGNRTLTEPARSDRLFSLTMYYDGTRWVVREVRTPDSGTGAGAAGSDIAAP